MKLFLNKWFVWLLFSCMQLNGSVVQLPDLVSVEQGLTALVTQAHTNTAIPDQKVRLEQLQAEASAFFAAYHKDLGLNIDSLGNHSYMRNSYTNFLESFKPLAAQNKLIKAHHIRVLVKKAKQLSCDLVEYIEFLLAKGHTVEEVKLLDALKKLCNTLVAEFFKEEYFLPGTTLEIIKDLLLYRSREKMMEHKVATLVAAILAWELLGRVGDPEHEKSYSRPLSTVKDLIFGKKEEIALQSGPNKNPLQAEGENPLQAKGKNPPAAPSSEPTDPDKPIKPAARKKDPRFKDYELVDEAGNAVEVPKEALVTAATGNNDSAVKVYYDSGEYALKSKKNYKRICGFIPDQEPKYIFENEEVIQQTSFKHASSCGQHALWNSYCHVSGADRMDKKARDAFVKGALLKLPAENTGNFTSADELAKLVHGLNVLVDEETTRALLEEAKEGRAALEEKTEELKKEVDAVKAELEAEIKKLKAQLKEAQIKKKPFEDVFKKEKAAIEKIKNKDEKKKKIKELQAKFVEDTKLLDQEIREFIKKLAPLEKQLKAIVDALEQAVKAVDENKADKSKYEQELEACKERKTDKAQTLVQAFEEKMAVLNNADGLNNRGEGAQFAFVSVAPTLENGSSPVSKLIENYYQCQAEGIMNDFVLHPNIQNFQKEPSIPQVLVIHIGAHYITVRFELVEENGVKKAKATVLDSLKGKDDKYAHNKIIETYLFLFTRGMPYQCGTEFIHQEPGEVLNIDLEEDTIIKALTKGSEFPEEIKESEVYKKALAKIEADPALKLRIENAKGL